MDNSADSGSEWRLMIPAPPTSIPTQANDLQPMTVASPSQWRIIWRYFWSVDISSYQLDSVYSYVSYFIWNVEGDTINDWGHYVS